MRSTRRSHSANITLTDFDGRPWVQVEFEHEGIPAWTISLCLLEAGLIETVRLSSLRPPFTLQFALDRGLPTGDRAQAQRHDAALDLALSLDELSYWTAFFLKYCRDNMGAHGNWPAVLSCGAHGLP